MNTQQTLDKLKLRPFTPSKIISGPLRQTIIPYYLPFKEKPTPGVHHQISMTDGDSIVISLNQPPQWQNGDRIVILIHGLAGSEDSPYIVRIGRKLYDLGYSVVKVNLRSCGPGRGLARKPYHSGQSEDTRQLLKWLEKKFPRSPVTQVGFSLSANITLKMLGEEANHSLCNLDSAIAVSPPMDLLASAYKITELSFRLFDHFFMIKLKKSLKELYSDFPDLEPVRFPKKMNMIAFDDNYTAPRSGFASAYDYYKKVSSKFFVPTIKKPTLILHSTDDPVVESDVLGQLSIPRNIDVLEFEKGGHVGFYDNKGFWMDEAVIRWIEHFHPNP